MPIITEIVVQGVRYQLQPTGTALVTTTTPGSMSAEDKVKLDGIDTSIFVPATTTSEGFMSASDKVKLDGLTQYVLPTISDTVLGGAKVDNVTIEADNGVLSTKSIVDIRPSDTVITIELANNTIYRLSNAEITSITLTAAASMEYCVVDFNSGSATTINSTVGWTWVGADCAENVFTPVASKRYRLAVEQYDSSVIITVQKVE